MNVLFITNHNGLMGSSRSLINLLDGLEDINPFVVIPQEGQIQRELELRQIPYRILPLHFWVTNEKTDHETYKKYVKDLRSSIPLFEQLMNEVNFDAIYSNSSVFPIGRILSWRHHIPHIWHLREFGDLDYSLYRLIPKWLCRLFILSSKLIFCNSNAIRDYYFGNRIDPKIRVIYNGIATYDQITTYRAIRKETPQNQVYTFLISGTLSGNKGQESAIKALATVISRGFKARLIVAGPGHKKDVQKYKMMVESMELNDNIEFTGYLDDPIQIFFSSDCLLMCSENEAFGRVTAEAMATGLPVIGKNSGGTPEIIHDKVTGFLYNTDEELIDAMIRLIKSPKEGFNMGLAGWQRAREEFTIEKYSSSIYNAMKSILRKSLLSGRTSYPPEKSWTRGQDTNNHDLH